MPKIRIPVTLSNKIQSYTTSTAFTGTFACWAESTPIQIVHGLIRYNFSNVPKNLKLYGVDIVMTYDQVGNVPNTKFNIFQLRRSFNAACTWNTYDGGNLWGTNGARSTTSDIYATVLGNLNITTTGVPVITTLNSSGVSVFQEWLKGTSTNTGLAFEFTDVAHPGYQCSVTTASTSIFADLYYYPLPSNFRFVDMQNKVR